MKNAAGLAMVALVLLVGGCGEILGIPGSITEDAGGKDVGKDVTSARVADASDATKARDAADAGLPPGAAVSVTSDTFKQVWCALTANGDIECWGDNSWGELGNGDMTFTSSATPVKVVGLPAPAAQVSLGCGVACAVTTTGGAWCWGLGSSGQLGDDMTTAFTPTPQPVSGMGSGVRAISPGDLYTCALKDNGSVWCWGTGEPGMYAGRGLVPTTVPSEMPGLGGAATEVSVGYDMACAVVNGGVMCWGGLVGSNGELGNGTPGGSVTPVAVTGLTMGVTSVSVGDFFACALTEAGAVECWGFGDQGSLGNGQFASSPVPVAVEGLSSGVAAISAGANEACALKHDGSVWCWGDGSLGALGDGAWDASAATYQSGVPVQVQGLPAGGATFISSGTAPCAVTIGGSVECWGHTSEDALTPVPVSEITNASSVSVGGAALTSSGFACAVTSSGDVECWGDNGAGQLGNDTGISTSTPVMGLGPGAVAASAGQGGVFACGIQTGVVECWGDNSLGQLGNGTTKSSPASVSVQGLPGVAAAVSAGGGSACALVAAGALDGGAVDGSAVDGDAVYCWGDNDLGQLGDGTTAPRSVAGLVDGLGSGVISISVGADFACALLTGGTVACWGDNALGELGTGSGVSARVPTPVPGLAGVTAISAGVTAACAVANAGVYCWGDNSNSIVSLNASFTANVLPPTPLPVVSTGVTQVAVGSATACAIMNGDAWCWGTDAIGSASFSNGTVTGPLAVTGLSSGVTSISVGTAAACAVRGGGAGAGGVWCWGYNSAGQLGNGGAVDDLVATPISGFP
jgi:alpha-tubulin suppressor-like RCC1 family protein